MRKDLLQRTVGVNGLSSMARMIMLIKPIPVCSGGTEECCTTVASADARHVDTGFTYPARRPDGNLNKCPNQHVGMGKQMPANSP